jgi:hypothetical protein
MWSGYFVMTISTVFFASGFFLAMFLLEKKVSSLEGQLLESQTNCEKCDYHAKYIAAKADCDATHEENRRLERRNWQLLGENRRLHSKVWRAADL